MSEQLPSKEHLTQALESADRYREIPESQRPVYKLEAVALLEEIERLRGLKPQLPPRPPDGTGLPRYGLRWNGPHEPLAVPMSDGYWTPWHLAAKATASETRACTCHPDDNPPRPCPQKFALQECRRAAQETNELLKIARDVSTMDCFYTGAQCAPDCQCLSARATRAVAPPSKASVVVVGPTCGKDTPDGPCRSDIGHEGECDGLPY